MPIRPENQALYPGGSIRSPEWAEIRERIRARALDQCEDCAVRNGAHGGRVHDGTFLSSLPKGTNGLGLDWPRPGEYAWCGLGDRRDFLRVIRIVCTVAHLDHDPTNNDDANLRFLCQRCHNRHDQAHRRRNAAATRRRAQAQGDLFA